MNFVARTRLVYLPATSVPFPHVGQVFAIYISVAMLSCDHTICKVSI